jgi:hypothetical protein
MIFTLNLRCPTGGLPNGIPWNWYMVLWVQADVLREPLRAPRPGSCNVTPSTSFAWTASVDRQHNHTEATPSAKHDASVHIEQSPTATVSLSAQHTPFCCSSHIRGETGSGRKGEASEIGYIHTFPFLLAYIYFWLRNTETEKRFIVFHSRHQNAG